MMSKLSVVLKAVVLAMALAAPLGSAAADPIIIPPLAGTTYWQDSNGAVVGYMIVECDGTRHGPVGWITQYEVFVPTEC